MTINWEQLEKDNGPKFKAYAADGKYKVKIADVEFKEVGTNGSIAAEFKFEEADNYQFPKATHWLSFKNDNWRQWHFKCLLQVLGIAKASAEKAIEACESKTDKNAKVKAYEQTFKKAAARHQEVDIEVFTELNEANGKEYSRAEFLDQNVAMPHDSKPQAEPQQGILEESEDASDEIALDDIPFN